MIWRWRYHRPQEWAIVLAGFAFQLKGPRARPLFSERNRIDCKVTQLAGGWRIVR